MKKQIQTLVYCFAFCLFTNCSSDDDTPVTPTGANKSYELLSTNLSDLTGQVTFIENTNGSTTISIELDNTVDGINNAVRLRRNTANIGGGIAVNLNDINGNTGTSETTISKLDNGQEISYEELSEFTGYLSIEGKGDNTGEFYAYTDLGFNVLTGTKTTYNLFGPDGSINGLAVFEERKKGTAALTVNIFQISNDTDLPTSLHLTLENNIEEINHPLNSVKSKQNGFSFNEITEINAVPITYENLLKLDGYIEITDINDAMIILSSGGIGSNENAVIN